MQLNEGPVSDRLKARMEAIWNNDFDERFGIFLAGPKDPAHWDQSRLERPDDPQALEAFYNDPECMHARMRYEVENRYYLGDAFPCLFPFWGTAGHVKYFPVNYEYKKETIWFFPRHESLNELPISCGSDNQVIDQECERLARLVELSGGRYAVSMPDNCGSMDMLSELIHPSELMMEMITDPELVTAHLDGAVDALIQSGDRMFDMIRPSCGGTAHGWMNLWSPGKMMQLQCDLSVMLSPQQFEQFVLPELERTTAWLDHSVYHLDGQEQIRHLDMLLSLKRLNMIQWQPVAGQPPITEFIPQLQRIQQAGKGLVLRCWPNEIEPIVNALSPKGVMILCRDRTLPLEDARALLRIVERASLEKR